MSLPLAERCVSNPRQQLAVITIVVVVVLASPMWAKIVGAYVDAASFLALCLAVSGTAAKYRNHSNHRRTASLT
ncbi:hypothetical protein [Streptomyces leeuwenhoekii]|uniref:Uncharacterized protein n=1 Tax=Streptomyces leeuwenhoekii TaxID=1437453 RepID=A0A0F7VTA2_STRLW|nr:hypothetical protein [Streptomyces leeuwenhoekii]CQR62880.1 Hypothetical Protein sle_34190 [Streptomyces leeuwenhoekii]